MKNPEISFEKVKCNFCGKDTGTETECEKLNKQNKRQLIRNENKDSVLPVFAPDCTYKKRNLWIVHINYPLTLNLLEKLKEVSGVSHISQTNPYSLTVEIARLLDENQVKRNLAITYRTYIKALVSLTSQDRNDEERKEPNDVNGIVLPNGFKCIVNDSDVLSELLSSIDGSKPITKGSQK